jgi:hypothetical protein
MPTVIVEADEGRTVEQKRGLVKDITDAVCKNYNVSFTNRKRKIAGRPENWLSIYSFLLP